jgi:hypothetical protein
MNPAVIYNREFEVLKDGDGGDGLREGMRTLDARPVREFAIKPERVVHPEAAPVEIVLRRGAINLPATACKDGRLAGMGSAREVLVALHARAER